MKNLLKPLTLVVLACSSLALADSAKAISFIPVNFSVHAETGYSVVGAPVLDRILNPSDDLKTAYKNLGVKNLADKIPQKYKNWTKGISSIIPFPINYGQNYGFKGTAQYSVPLSSSFLGLSGGIEAGFGYVTLSPLNKIDSIKNYVDDELAAIDQYVHDEQVNHNIPENQRIKTNFKGMDFSYLAPDFSTGYFKLGLVAEADVLGFIGRASFGYLYTSTDPKLSSIYYSFYLGHTILFGIEAGVSFDFTGTHNGLANFYDKSIKNDASYKKVKDLASSHSEFKDSFNRIDKSIQTVASEYANLSYRLESINLSFGYKF